ncbi:MAG: pyridoxal phosphate-dependent aminotransferase, partial [Thermoplasmata archaeon]|nr:pyridoxal phosphate-dependent aminotransferase [Thermoplasmata archaeon]
MVSFAQRVERMRESGTLGMANKADDLIEEGKDIISFSMGEPDFTTPQHIIDAAKRALDEGFTHYTASNGIKCLREAIAKKCREENGIPATCNEVMVTIAKHAISIAILSSVDIGEEVIIPNPCWTSYHALINIAKGRPVSVEVNRDNDFRMKPADIMEKLSLKSRVIILNSPSNPTGGVATKQDLKGIAEIAMDHNLTVISDEIYEKVIYEGKHHSIAAIDGMFDRTYTINGFSKAYAMTGWRVGWVTASKELLRPLERIQQHSITCVTSFVQKAALEALVGPMEPIHEFVRIFKKRRDLIVKELNRIEGFHINKPKGAFYAFPAYDYDIASLPFAMKLLDHGIALTPG